MGDLIEGPWGKRPKGPDGPSKPPEKPADSQETGGRQYLDMVKFLIELRNSDPRSFDPKDIDIRKGAIAGNTPRELLDMLAKSNKFEWQARPSLHHAIARKIVDEMKALRDEGGEVNVDILSGTQVYGVAFRYSPPSPG